MALEAEVLGELDRLMTAPEGLGKRNPVATWVCLWGLILTYRAYISFIYLYFREDNGGNYPSLSESWLYTSQKESE